MQNSIKNGIFSLEVNNNDKKLSKGGKYCNEEFLLN